MATRIFATNTLHSQSHNDFSTYCKTQVTLKSQLLAAVDDAYVNELNDPLWGYSQVTVLQLLTHLRETYGRITPDQVDKNAATLDREWNPEDPMEKFWQRVRECHSFALAGDDAITEAFAVRKTPIGLEKTGVFADAARNWCKPPTHLSRLGPSFRSTSKSPTTSASASSPPKEPDTLASMPLKLLLLPPSWNRPLLPWQL